MESRILMLRAINVGARRLAMSALRELLSAQGLADVRTYLQSGNAVVSTDASPEELASACRRAISRHAGFDVPVIVRTETELAAVLARDPFGQVATEPKRYWVSFLDRELGEDRVERLRGLIVGDEQLHTDTRELYAWLPGGGGRSKLATALANPGPGVVATARNWTTVTALHDMARAGGGGADA